MPTRPTATPRSQRKRRKLITIRCLILILQNLEICKNRKALKLRLILPLLKGVRPHQRRPPLSYRPLELLSRGATTDKALNGKKVYGWRFCDTRRSFGKHASAWTWKIYTLYRQRWCRNSRPAVEIYTLSSCVDGLAYLSRSSQHMLL